MKTMRWMLALVVLLGAAMPDDAAADRRHRHGGARIGLYLGAPLYWGPPGPYYPYPPAYYPYYPPYYAYPPVIAVPSSPPVYIERGADETGSSRAEDYWYYCDRPAGYYPDVKECPDGWQRVAPRSSR